MQNNVMVFDSVTRSFSQELHPIMGLEEGEVLVRVLCCTICGSDLHTWQGRRSAPQRCVLGHEIIGEIVDWGGSEPPLDYFGVPIRTGQRITWSMAVGCGECFYCRNDVSQKCENLFKYGHELADGKNSTGGLSNFCQLVKNTAIFPIPESLPDAVATPGNCATATVSAAIRLIFQTHSIQGASVLIVGMGMLGLTASAWLAEHGAKVVVAFDRDANRATKSSAFGATHQTDCPKELPAIIESVSAGRGVDLALDFAGVSSAVELAIAHTRIGGCTIFAGSVFPTEEISISPESVVRQMKTIRGIHNYQPVDLQNALEFLAATQGRYPFQNLVEKQFRLAEIEDAFRFAAEERPIRIAIV